MTFLCNYSNIFGTPNEGVHSIRIFNVAVVDVLATVLVAWLLTKYYVGPKYGLKFWHVLLILLILGFVMHRLFCVRTTFDKMLFS